MNIEPEIVYVNNKEYIYVLSNKDDYDNKQIDVSIFELKEWNFLLKISKAFETAVLNARSASDDIYCNISQTLKKSIYYLNYSAFCHNKGFNDLKYETSEINHIHTLVFNLVKEAEDTEKITINDFRKWIAKNYNNIQLHYENITQKYNQY
jgi:hypothetical protein